MEICKGSTRIVFLIGKYAYKLPSFYSWRLFLNGLLANMQENEFSNTKWEGLCPVVFGLPGGFLTVMKRAEPFPDKLWPKLKPKVESWSTRDGHRIPVEAKQSSFGVLDGGIVAVDYGS